MSKAKVVKTPEQIAEAKAKADAKAAAKLGASGEVSVLDNKTGVTRTYTEAEHGENFAELAAEFAGKSASREIVK